MMKCKNRQGLQLFAENSAASAPEEKPAAGQQRLRELGVPEEKLRKNRARQENPAPAEGQAAADKMPEGRLSWEQILKDPEYNAQLQKIIRARVKEEGRNFGIQ